jgi:hypothetical protein
MLLHSDQSSCVWLRRVDGVCRFSVPWHFALISICMTAIAFLAGCESGATTRAGSISVTYPNGVTANQFPVLSTAAVSMTPLNDKVSAGVDWTLKCGGSPLSAPVPGGTSVGCGTVLPAHTASGVPATYTAPALIPVGSTVTITATVTSDPSQTSSVALTIVPLPVVVSLPSAPTSMAVSATAHLTASLTNDTSEAGAKWAVTCGSSDCGSFNPVQTASGASTTYTAPAKSPAGGTVTITATSVANSADSTSATVSILPIAVKVSPATYTVAVSGNANFTATVTNDVKNSGVTWSCSPSGSCGAFSPASTPSGTATTYTAPAAAPAGGVVTITATSATDGTTSASAAAAIGAAVISVTMSRTVPASLAEGKTATLGATVSGDSTNAGVDWTVSCGSTATGACGTFNPATTSSGSTTTYTAPSSLPPTNPVTITATSHAHDLNPSLVANAASATTTITAPASITFTEQPPTTITTTGEAPVSASVTNDATPGGVTWSIQCANTAVGACGYVAPHQTADGETATYVAPPTVPGVPVQIRATSTAFPATSVLSTSVTVTQSPVHSVAFVPFAPSQLLQGTTVMLNAAVTNDPSHAGVDWTVCGNGCGFFTIVPARAAIPAVPPSPGNPGSPYVPAVPAVTATSALGWPNGVPISYTAPDEAPESGTVFISATATADRLNDVATPATAASNIVITSEATGPALNGVVQAGTQPVVGASVYLYAAGTSGYASASIPISSPNTTGAITTNSTGSFTVPAGYACPQLTSLVYLVATGGHVGSSAANPNLALMTTLGPCSNLGSSPVVVNEVTTVASASALAPFSADDAMTGNSSYLNIGSSSANATTGLTNAFATVTNLVNIGTGRPLYNTLAGNAAIPYVEINTFADIINACAVTSGGSAGDGSTCGNIFTDANPLQGSDTAAAPTDTLQAVFDLVKPPDANTLNAPLLTAIYSAAAISASSPYQPILTGTPHDWSIALNYSSGGGVGGSGITGSGSSAFALDAAGNLWITNANTNSVSEWSNLGAPISPAVLSGTAGGFTPAGLSAPGPIAVDANDFIWVANGNGSLEELDSTAAPVNGSPFLGGGLSTTPIGMAIDATGSIWITNSGSPGDVARFSNGGLALSPATGYTNGIDDPFPIAVDESNNVWTQNEIQQNSSVNSDGLTELNGASGAFIASAGGAFAGAPGQFQMAVDSSGNVWEASACTIWEISASTTTPGVLNSTSHGAQTVDDPRAVAVDGANRLWVASTGNASNCSNTITFPPPNVSLIDTSNGYAFAHQSLSNNPLFLAVDSSGNLWVLLSNNTVTEFVGVATPAVTPLASAVKNNMLGAKP